MKVLTLLLIALVAVATGFATTPLPTNASVPERMTYGNMLGALMTDGSFESNFGPSNFG